MDVRYQKAAVEDEPEIRALLMELDLFFPARIPEDFWIAKEKDSVVGVLCLTEMGDDLFLSSVGVVEKERGRGHARALIEAATKDVGGTIYLLTIIPGFFEKLGFKVCEPPPHLPSRAVLHCDTCAPDRCVCMRKE